MHYTQTALFILQMQPENNKPAELLYEPAILAKLDFSKSSVKFNPVISAANPGPGLLVRPLSTADYDKGIII